MPRLSDAKLRGKVLEAVRASGWLPRVLEGKKPLLIRASASPTDLQRNLGLDLRVHIRNCTHGGGNRDANEYRMQLTTRVSKDRRAITMLLAYHEDTDVFAAWDVAKHKGSARSQSAQVRLETLEAAEGNGLAAQKKDNEIVVAFRPEMLMEYAQAQAALHRSGRSIRDIDLINNLLKASEASIRRKASSARRAEVLVQMRRKARSAAFPREVLEAYEHKCAFCGLQLGLVQAAHIHPVEAPDSTDDVSNGIALCALHHLAFDAGLLHLTPKLKLTVDRTRLDRVRCGGLAKFERGLLAELKLPSRPELRPSPLNIRKRMKFKGW